MKDVFAYTQHEHTGILLNANEKSENLETRLIQDIQQAIPSIAFNRYPDDSYTALRERYGQLLSLDPDQIIVGNGSDQMLGLMIGTFLSKGKSAFTFSPDFGMYDYYVSMYDGELNKFELEDLRTIDLDDFIQRAQEVDPSLILFSNPNNPTGIYLDPEAIEQILKAFPSIPVLVDEAYIEFAPRSAIELIDTYPNLYITRTLSKAFGLAGIRLGFLISQKANIDRIKKNVVPYSVSQLSETVGRIVLGYEEEARDHVEKTKARRDGLIERGKAFETIEIYPSQANFVLVKADRLDRLAALMKENDIVIRTYDQRPYVRITIGSEEEMERVQRVFEQVERESL